MSLYVLGLNHHTAPVDIREKVAFPNDRQRSALEDLVKVALAAEAVLVSTCNRTELYLRGDEAMLSRAEAWLQSTPNAANLNLAPHLYKLKDEAATRHAFRVAAGLDSMVLGEPQILGQVRQAVKVAAEAGTLGGPLDRLFQDTFQAAKHIRTDTEIGAASVSMAAAALKLAQQLFGDMREVRLLLIGVGEMISLAATHFSAQSLKNIVVANRTLSRAKELAAAFDTPSCPATAISLSEVSDRIHEFDAVITSTASSLPIIGKGMVEPALRLRKRKPMFFVDLAVPRDIEAAVGDMDDIFLYTLDSLGKIIQQNMATREAALVSAEEIVNTHVQQYQQWLTGRGTVPAIQQLRSRADQYRNAELERAQKMLARGDNPRIVLELLAQGLTNKFLHHPMTALKRVSGDQHTALAAALEQLYPPPAADQTEER
ncbi:MAG: glutamyl-tRNA reductase [Aeromicrobium sp.]|nr:glutamyl-tRNA reductase [Burkholderiales bacterium]